MNARASCGNAAAHASQAGFIARAMAREYAMSDSFKTRARRGVIRRSMTAPALRLAPAFRDRRELADLVSVGPATLADFELLGVRTVAELARHEPTALYARLERITLRRQDPCVLDTFSAAVAQARDPHLPPEEAKWWTWSRRRKVASVDARAARRT
jgi:hypothetical protein